MARDLDEMRAFKAEEKRLLDLKDSLLAAGERGQRVTVVFVDMDLAALRARHEASVENPQDVWVEDTLI